MPCIMPACSTSCVREPAALEPLADELIALAGEHGLAFWQALGRVFRGDQLLEAGRADAGLAELRAGIAAYRDDERPACTCPTC